MDGVSEQSLQNMKLRTRVVTVVPNTIAEEIIEDLLNSIGSQNEPRGVIIVKEVSNVYEIGY